MMLLSESEFTEFENFQNIDSARMIIYWILIRTFSYLKLDISLVGCMMLLSESEFTEFESFQNVDSALNDNFLDSDLLPAIIVR